MLPRHKSPNCGRTPKARHVRGLAIKPPSIQKIKRDKPRSFLVEIEIDSAGQPTENQYQASIHWLRNHIGMYREVQSKKQKRTVAGKVRDRSLAKCFGVNQFQVELTVRHFAAVDSSLTSRPFVTRYQLWESLRTLPAKGMHSAIQKLVSEFATELGTEGINLPRRRYQR